jgi:hypothetical protein
VKRDDIGVRIKLVQIFGDVLTVPGIPPEPENKRANARRCVGWNMDPSQPISISRTERKKLGTARQRACRCDGMRRKD